jgi:transcriptional regulator with AAA-type ATPase domain
MMISFSGCKFERSRMTARDSSPKRSILSLRAIPLSLLRSRMAPPSQSSLIGAQPAMTAPTRELTAAATKLKLEFIFDESLTTKSLFRLPTRYTAAVNRNTEHAGKTKLFDVTD